MALRSTKKILMLASTIIILSLNFSCKNETTNKYERPPEKKSFINDFKPSKSDIAELIIGSIQQAKENIETENRRRIMAQIQDKNNYGILISAIKDEFCKEETLIEVYFEKSDIGYFSNPEINIIEKTAVVFVIKEKSISTTLSENEYNFAKSAFQMNLVMGDKLYGVLTPNIHQVNSDTKLFFDRVNGDFYIILEDKYFRKYKFNSRITSDIFLHNNAN